MLWALWKPGHQVDFELLPHGEYGWEVRILKDYKFFAHRLYEGSSAEERLDLREKAIAWSEESRQSLVSHQWKKPRPSVTQGISAP